MTRLETIADGVAFDHEACLRCRERFPALDESLSATAVSIDGEIIQDPFLEPVGPDSEVHFLPQIGGG